MPQGESITLHLVLPEYDRREVHSRWIDASPAAVWAALHETIAADLPVSKALMSIRSAGRTKLMGPLLAMRPDQQPLAETEGHEIVRGLVTRAWRPTPRIHRLPPGASAFTAFDEPGWVKVAIDLRLTPERRGTRLSTETRCKTTDGRSQVVFALYWTLIRIGSGIIRRETLAAVARRAERVPRASGS
jgi:hypothetical protein